MSLRETLPVPLLPEPAAARPIRRPPADWARLFRSTTFRLTLIYLCLFSASVLLLLGFIYWSTTAAVTRQIESTVDAEITGLAEQYKQRGLVGLLQAIERRAATPGNSGLYLLADRNGQPLAGNLSRWPAESQGVGALDGDVWITFRLELPDDAGGPGGSFGRARVFDLRGGLHLLVGHDVREQSHVAGLIRESLIWGLAATVLLSLGGGLLMSRLLMRRIDSINATSHEIMSGDFSRRVPLSGRGDEFDRLAGNLNAMLAQIERLLDGMKQVSDNIAHDLRSPLARLRSRLEVTLMAPPDAARDRDALRETIGEADQILQTFNALLSIAQAEAGADRSGFTRLDLSALVDDVADLYGPLAEEKGLTVTATAQPGLTILGDRDLLFQALANLLDNAIKFSSPGDKIALGTRLAENAALITVGDRGPGIPADLCDRVQERFFRLESSRSTPGSGLGLSLVAAVARLHGGSLDLRDNDPGLQAELRLPLG